MKQTWQVFSIEPSGTDGRWGVWRTKWTESGPDNNNAIRVAELANWTLAEAERERRQLAYDRIRAALAA